MSSFRTNIGRTKYNLSDKLEFVHICRTKIICVVVWTNICRTKFVCLFLSVHVLSHSDKFVQGWTKTVLSDKICLSGCFRHFSDRLLVGQILYAYGQIGSGQNTGTKRIMLQVFVVHLLPPPIFCPTILWWQICQWVGQILSDKSGFGRTNVYVDPPFCPFRGRISVVGQEEQEQAVTVNKQTEIKEPSVSEQWTNKLTLKEQINKHLRT